MHLPAKRRYGVFTPLAAFVNPTYALLMMNANLKTKTLLVITICAGVFGSSYDQGSHD